MRQIHPVSLHEKFVASGTYRPSDDKARLFPVSHWTIHELPDGSQLIRSDEQSHHMTVLVEALRSSPDNGSRIERFDVFIHTADSRQPAQRLKASCFFARHLQSVISDGDGRAEAAEIPLPDEYLVQPPALIFTGFVIAQAALQPDKEIPLLTFAFHRSDRISLQLSEGTISARFLEMVEYPLENRLLSVEKHLYRQWFAPDAGQPVTGTYLIDRQQIIVDWESAGLTLINYARRPDPKPKPVNLNP